MVDRLQLSMVPENRAAITNQNESLGLSLAFFVVIIYLAVSLRNRLAISGLLFKKVVKKGHLQWISTIVYYNVVEVLENRLPLEYHCGIYSNTQIEMLRCRYSHVLES